MREDIKNALQKLKNNNIEPDQLNININCNENMAKWLNLYNPDNLINRYDIDIELSSDPVIQEKQIIGTSVCFYIKDYDWVNEKLIDIYDVADAHSGDLELAVSPVFNTDGSLKDDYFYGGVLYIHRLYLKPKFRNKGIGTLALSLIIDLLSREAGVVTVIPVPYQENGTKKIDGEDPEYEMKRNIIVDLFEKFKFVQDDEYSEVWVKNTELKD